MPTAPPDPAGPDTAKVRPKPARARSDRAIAEWSSGRHHVVTLAQLRSLGLSARAVRHRAASGRLRRLHHGVYATEAPSRESRWLAAVLACGPGAALSHRSAAALWGLYDRVPMTIDVTVRTRAGRSRQGLTVHRGGTLATSEVTTRDRIPCTTLARTLLDFAAVVDRRTLERAIDRAEMLRIFDLSTIHAALDSHLGRRGTRALRTALAAYAEPAVTRSAAEEHFVALVHDAGLPRPRVNVPIALDDGTTYEADFLWRDARLIVEVDGRTYHARRAAFEHDRRRDRRLALAGFETRRYAARELLSDPASVQAEMGAFLRRRA
jgi:very-short-patch-repair endonuclease